MRNPERWLKAGLATLLAGVAMLGLGVAVPTFPAGSGLRAMLAGTGIAALFGGGLWALSSRRALHARQALQRGERLVARWRVDADTWHAFASAQAQPRAGDPWVPNELSIPDAIPAHGVEVAVGEEAIDIGGSVHVLPRRGAPEVLGIELIEGRGQPDILELQLLHPAAGVGASGQPRRPTRTRLAFPVAPGAWREARKVQDIYGRGRPGKPDFFHGRGDGSDPEDLATCWSCGRQTHQFRSRCEGCGASLQSRRWSRRFGAVLLVLGLFITATIGTVLFHLGPELSGAIFGASPTTGATLSRFDGTPGKAALAAAILLAVLAFGVATAAYGGWQVATGRRDIRIVYAACALTAGVLLLAQLL